jgi:DNA-binding response OmpR family regulator
VSRTILIVDDEADSRAVLKHVLEADDYHVITADRAEAAAAAAAAKRPDLVLCDVVLPSMDGMALCRQLRADKRTAGVPIMLMSGLRRGEAEQACGLEFGADDYLLKPVSPRLLLARVRAVLRRGPVPDDEAPPLRSGSLLVDRAARLVSAGSRRLPLTRKEFDLLALLLEKRGRVLGSAFLMETVWGCDTDVYRDPHTIEVHVSSLRRKLGQALAKRIVTVPGVGYRFEKD